MSNDYFTPSGYPGNRAAGSSASMRAEIAAIAAAFDKLPALSGNGGKFTVIDAGGTAVTTSSALVEASSRVGVGVTPSVARFEAQATAADTFAILARNSAGVSIAGFYNSLGGEGTMTLANGSGVAKVQLTATSGINYINGGGALGVGTSSPGAGYALDVAGTIRGIGGEASAAGYGLRLLNATQNGGGHLTPGVGAAGGLQLGSDAGPLTIITNGSERARLTAAGGFLLGTTAALPVGAKFSAVYAGASSEYGIALRPSADNTLALVFFNAANSLVGSIAVGTTSTTYNTTSDYRLKTVEGPVTDSGAFIDSLRPVRGTWKADGSQFVGFLAHEFQAVSPGSVTGARDAVGADGAPVYQSMQASSPEVMANVIAELQSVRRRLSSLEAA